ncbi:MAG: glycosyltransferase family 4 protein [bacterium]
MRILLVSSAFYPYPSGISEHVYYLAKGLKARGHDVKILTTHYPKRWEDELLKDLEIIRFGKVIFLPLNKSYATLPFSTQMPFQVKRFLEAEEFDVIHLHGIYPPEIGFWVLHFSKTINCATFHTAGFKKNPFPKFASFLFEKYNKKLNGKIAVSATAKKWIEPSIPGEYRIIPNGIDCARFSPSIPPLKRKNEKFPIILFVGRLDERKGVMIAIRAFQEVIKDFPAARLWVIGQGQLENKAKLLVDKMNLKDSCSFWGYVKRDQLPNYFASCDVYISPALGGESQGIVLLEAMASEKPVVASNIEGYRGVINDGETGILFTTGSAEDLAIKTKMVLKNDNLRQNLAKNGRIRALEFGWDKIVKQIEEYYWVISN